MEYYQDLLNKEYSNKNTNTYFYLVCPAGRFVDAGNSNTCTECAINTYSDSTDLSECTACPTGEITSGTGSTNITDCGKLYLNIIDLYKFILIDFK